MAGKKELVPCKPHQYRDRSTNRCRNYKNAQKRTSPKRASKTPSRKELVPCKSHQYRDPVTNRCRNYKNAQKRTSPKRTPRRKELVPCKPHQYRDPVTNRCKNLPKQPANNVYYPPMVQPPPPPMIQPPPPPMIQPPPPPMIQPAKTPPPMIQPAKTPPVPVGPGIPYNFNKLAEDCTRLFDWKLGKELGKGHYGVAYQVCKAKNDLDCKYVLKRQKADKDFFEEVYALEDLQNTGVVPKLYAAWICNNDGFLVIELLETCNLDEESEYKQVKDALNKIKEKGWLHVDIHRGNVRCANDGKKVMLIDFGWAIKQGKKGYPEHPLSKQFGFTLSWKELELMQNINLMYSFNRNFLYDTENDLKKIYREYYLLNPQKLSSDNVKRMLKYYMNAIEHAKNKK